MKITIIDIAKKLNIHPSTVSLALNHSPKISLATRKKVQKKAEEMGYKSNPYVSALMSARRSGKLPKNPPTLAFITTSETPDGWKKMYNYKKFYEGCETVAQSLGMRIEPFWLGDKNMTAKRLNDILYNRRIQGGIFLPIGSFREKTNVPWNHIAAVSYGIYDITPSIDRVKADHYGNMEEILGRLDERGLKRVGFVMEPPYPYTNHNRWLAAYLMAQQDRSPNQRIDPWLDPSPSFEGFKAWFDKAQPDAVICVRSKTVSQWLSQLDLRIPDDISLVTVGTARDDEPFSGMIENAATCGKLAVEVLLERIHQNRIGPLESPRCITVRGRWHPGTTLRGS